MLQHVRVRCHVLTNVRFSLTILIKHVERVHVVKSFPLSGRPLRTQFRRFRIEIRIFSFLKSYQKSTNS